MAGVPEVSTNNNIPSPYAVNPLVAVMQGFQSFQAAKQQKQLFDLNMKQQQATVTQDQSQAQQTAMQQYQTLGQYGLKMPEAMKSPQAQQRWQQLAQAAGMPVPYNPDGTFNAEPFKKELDVNAIQAARDMQPGPARDALLAQYSNVPGDLYTSPADYSGKVRADMTRAQNQGTHWQNADATASSRERVYADKTQWAHELDPAKKAELEARVKVDNARAFQATATANRNIADTTRITAELAAGIPQLKAQALAYKSSPSYGNERALSTTYRTMLTSTARARTSMEGADAAYEQAWASGADPQTLAPFSAKKAQAEQAYQTAVTMLQQTYSALQSQSGSSATLRAGMGAKHVSVGGKIDLPPPPKLVTGGSPGTAATTDDSNRGEYFSVNPNNLPKGTQTVTAGNGQTYFKVGSAFYDSSGQRVNSDGTPYTQQ